MRLLTGITGKDPAFAPRVSTFGLPAWVDVRNVADAHIAALGLPQGASERFLLCGGVDYFEDGLAGLRARGEQGLGEEGAKVDRQVLRCEEMSMNADLDFQDVSLLFGQKQG
jgi:hypothetical protein